MRKTYRAGYPDTLPALLTWSERNGAGGDRRCDHADLARFARPRPARGGRTTEGRHRRRLTRRSVVAERHRLSGCYLRLRSIGAVAVHINTRFRAAEVGGLLRRTRAVALVTQWGFAPVDFPAIFSALPQEDRTALRSVLAPQRSLNATTLAGLPVLPLEGDAADAERDEAMAGAPCLTFTTSGTTS